MPLNHRGLEAEIKDGPMERSNTQFATALGLLFCTGFMYGQGEIPIGTLEFGAPGEGSRLSGTILRARLSPRSDGSHEAIATIRIVVGSNLKSLAEFTLDTNFSSQRTFQSIQIRNKQTSTVQADAGVTAASPLVVRAGAQQIVRKNEIAAFNTKLLNPDPEEFELVMVQLDESVLRADVIPARQSLAGSALSGPPNSSATAFLIASITRNLNRSIAAAQVEFILSYQVPARSGSSAVNITGLRVLRTSDSKVVFDANLAATPIPDSGSGKIRVRAEVPQSSLADADVQEALESLSADPSAYAMVLSTTVSTVSGALLATDRLQAPAELCASTTCTASSSPRADAMFVADLVRNADLTTRFALVSFNALHTGYPENTIFNGFKIVRGSGSSTGPVLIDSGISNGNPYYGSGQPLDFIGVSTILNTAGPLGELDALARSLFTANYGLRLESNTRNAIYGLLRTAQALVTGGAVPETIQAGNTATPMPVPRNDVVTVSLAKGSLFMLNGKFAVSPYKISSSPWPKELSRITVSAGGEVASLNEVSGTAVKGQISMGATLGLATIWVRFANDARQDLTPRDQKVQVVIKAAVPAIFEVGQDGDAVIGDVRFEGATVTSAKGVPAGSSVSVHATGLGVTSPWLEAGVAVPRNRGPYRTAAVAAVLDDGLVTVDATSSIAEPGQVGRYVVTIRLPNGLTPGYHKLQLRMGSELSNAVDVFVKAAP